MYININKCGKVLGQKKKKKPMARSLSKMEVQTTYFLVGHSTLVLFYFGHQILICIYMITQLVIFKFISLEDYQRVTRSNSLMWPPKNHKQLTYATSFKLSMSTKERHVNVFLLPHPSHNT